MQHCSVPDHRLPRQPPTPLWRLPEPREPLRGLNAHVFELGCTKLDLELVG